jgi:valyl-tRNA synthetase
VEDYVHSVGYSDRSHVPIEPYLSEQWFLRYPSVKVSTDAVEKGVIRFFPERWSKTYTHWMSNIKDWCISRQLWWGHQIPVWYHKKTREIHCDIEPPKDAENWEQDPDVLDTWFSSWLWPFATMGWPEKTETLKRFYPTSDLVTGPDIIFFWVARMIMAGYEYMGDLPFQNVYYTGIIRDKLGRKMSKMLGNSPNPLDLIAKYGADALRFGTMRSAPLGLDIRFDEQQVELGRNFCNKLWNAARLRLSQQADGPALRISDLRAADLGSDDKAILMRVEATIRDIHALYEGYEFNQVANRLYELFWSYYCDWYLEAAKTALYGADARRKAVTLAVMDHVLNAILRLLHPYMPFITEELWQALGFGVAGEAPPQTGEERREGERGRGTPLACPRILPPPGQDNGHASGVPLRPTSQGSIQFTPWPECLDEADLKRLGLDAARLRFVEQKYEAVTAGRNLRATYNIPSNRKVRFAMSGEGDWQADAGEVAVLRTLLNAEAIEFVKQAPPHTVSTVTPLGTFYLSLEGLVDAAAETQRLGKQIARLEKELEGVTAKLADEGFTSRAPAKAVDKHRARMDELKADIAKIRAQIAALGGK